MSVVPTGRSREIVDRTDILEVVIAYATALDTKDWALLGTLFTEDAYVVCEGVLDRQDGPAAIVAGLSAVVGPLDATQHINTNHVITVHSGEAEHTGYYQAQHVRHGLPGGELFTVGGTYADRLRRTPDGWRFTSRRVNVTWSQGNPAVVGA